MRVPADISAYCNRCEGLRDLRFPFRFPRRL
jgi:hypothetical protein